jgi:hypothetical protein
MGNIKQSVIRGHVIGDFFQFGGSVLFDSGALLEVGRLNMLPNSSAIFEGEFVGRIDQLSSGGELTFMQNCNVTYAFLSIALHSLVVFSSMLGAVISPTSTIELSGALLATKLVVMGSLVIPPFVNVTVSFPIVSDVDGGCSIQVHGHLTTASYFQLKTCEISGGGHLSILSGIAWGNTPVLSVRRLSIFKSFTVASGSSARFASSIVELKSCVAQISGNVFLQSFSHMILSSDSILTGQYAVLSGFESMTVQGSFAISNTVLEASVILFSEQSSGVCTSSAIRARSILTAGDSRIAIHYCSILICFAFSFLRTICNCA